MLTGKIEFSGKTLTDVEQAIDEAKGRIMDAFTSGQDSNESGSFSFTVDDDAEE